MARLRAFRSGQRLNEADHAAVLALSAGLLPVQVVELGPPRDRLPVIDPRPPDLDLHLRACSVRVGGMPNELSSWEYAEHRPRLQGSLLRASRENQQWGTTAAVISESGVQRSAVLLREAAVTIEQGDSRQRCGKARTLYSRFMRST